VSPEKSGPVPGRTLRSLDPYRASERKEPQVRILITAALMVAVVFGSTTIARAAELDWDALAKPMIKPFSLAEIRRQALAYADTLQVPGRPLGCYFDGPGSTNAPSLYASCDVAHMRTVMGEDLQKTLTPAQREAWIDHINSFARPDGTYGPGWKNHSSQHANGMVIGAFGALGGQQRHTVGLYDAFDTPEEVGPWLEKIDWRKQWSGSHLFWGGMHCFSLSRRCTDVWRDTVFQWLDANLDPQTGWWRKGVPQAGPLEPLGGGAHIWPIYQHHRRRFPYPEQVINSILALQKPGGSWLAYGSYMELDALYGLAYMSSLTPQYRHADILDAARRHGRGLVEQWPAFLARKPDLHVLLGAVGAFGLLQQLLPETFVDDARWTDIFSDPRFYRTRQVEVLENVRNGTKGPRAMSTAEGSLACESFSLR